MIPSGRARDGFLACYPNHQLPTPTGHPLLPFGSSSHRNMDENLTAVAKILQILTPHAPMHRAMECLALDAPALTDMEMERWYQYALATTNEAVAQGQQWPDFLRQRLTNPHIVIGMLLLLASEDHPKIAAEGGPFAGMIPCDERCVACALVFCRTVEGKSCVCMPPSLSWGVLKRQCERTPHHRLIGSSGVAISAWTPTRSDRNVCTRVVPRRENDPPTPDTSYVLMATRVRFWVGRDRMMMNRVSR